MTVHMEYGFALGCHRINQLWRTNHIEWIHNPSGILQQRLDAVGREFTLAFNDWLEAVTDGTYNAAAIPVSAGTRPYPE